MLYLNPDEPIILTWTDPTTGFSYCARVSLHRAGEYKGKIGVIAPDCVKIDTPSLNALESKRGKTTPPG